MVQTYSGEMKQGSTVIVIGTLLCAVRLVRAENSALGLLCAAIYCVIQLVKAYSLVFDKGYFKLFNSEKYQEKIPVSENGARLIQTRRKETARTISIKDVVMAILPLASTVAAWGIFSGFSMRLLRCLPKIGIFFGTDTGVYSAVANGGQYKYTRCFGAAVWEVFVPI